MRKLFVQTALVSMLALLPSAVHAQEWPYRPELPLAKGFHVEERPRYGLIIGGAVPLGLGAVSFFAGLSARSQCSDKDSYCSIGPNISIATGVIAMTVGGVLLIVGLSKPRLVVVPGDPAPGDPRVPLARSKERDPRLSFGLSGVGSGSGFSFQGAF